MLLIGVALLGFSLSSCSLYRSLSDAMATQIVEIVHTSQSNLDNRTLAPDSSSNVPQPSQAFESPAGEPGFVLFFDDFSDPTSGWENFSDDVTTYGYSDGSYMISITKPEYCGFSVLQRTFGDVIVEADITKVYGAADADYGLVCRHQEDQKLYIAGITTSGYYGLGKIMNGEPADLGPSEWQYQSTAIQSGSDSNHLRLTCNYDQLSLAANGTTIDMGKDSDLRTGDVGVYACAYDATGIEVLYDNFQVSQP